MLFLLPALCLLAPAQAYAAALTGPQIRALLTNNTMVVRETHQRTGYGGLPILLEIKRPMQFREDGSFLYRCTVTRPNGSTGNCRFGRGDLRKPGKFAGKSTGDWEIRGHALCFRGVFYRNNRRSCVPVHREGGRYYYIGYKPDSTRGKVPFTIRSGLRFD